MCQQTSVALLLNPLPRRNHLPLPQRSHGQFWSCHNCTRAPGGLSRVFLKCTTKALSWCGCHIPIHSIFIQHQVCAGLHWFRQWRIHLQHETQVRPLGREDPLEKEMATHSSVLAWRIPWTEEPGGPQRAWHDWATNTFVFKYVLNPGDKNISSFKHQSLKQAKSDSLWHSSILKL